MAPPLDIFDDASVKNSIVPPMKSLLVQLEINPAYTDHVAAQVDAWSFEFLNILRDDGDPQRKRKACFVRESKLGLLVAYAYPSAPAHKLLLMAKFMAWFFLADDFLDSSETSSTDLENAALAYKCIFKGRDLKEAILIRSRDLLRQLRMFSELWCDLRGLMTLQQEARFARSMIKVLDMFKVEASWSRRKIVPNRETYLWMREISSGVAPCFVAIDFMLNLGLDSSALEHPVLRKLEAIGTHHIALHNDLVSFKKEWVSGKYLNVVPILARGSKRGLDETIAEVVRLLEGLEREFVDARNELIRSKDSAVFKKEVIEYVRGIELWMVANVEWGLQSAKYHIFD